MPKNVFNLRQGIKDIYKKLREVFSKREKRLAFSELLQMTKEDKVAVFVSLLHLDNQQRIWLEQDDHLEEIWVLLKSLYEEQNKEKLAKLRTEVEALELEHEAEVVD